LSARCGGSFSNAVKRVHGQKRCHTGSGGGGCAKQPPRGARQRQRHAACIARIAPPRRSRASVASWKGGSSSAFEVRVRRRGAASPGIAAQARRPTALQRLRTALGGASQRSAAAARRRRGSEARRAVGERRREASGTLDASSPLALAAAPAAARRGRLRCARGAR